MDDFAKQATEWRTFADSEEVAGRCPHSGLRFECCKASLCDCFDYPARATCLRFTEVTGCQGCPEREAVGC